MNLTDRNIIIDRIKIELLNSLGDVITSAVVYGSTLCEDFCTASDFDIILVLKEINSEIFLKLRLIKERFSFEGISVDFNMHSTLDLPENRQDAFWHNNRSFYFRKEISLYGKIIIGENVFPIDKLEIADLQLEATRVLNSLLYQTRKYLVNKDLDQKNRRQIMKWCIYAVQYALAYKNIYPETKTEALNTFTEEYETTSDPHKFLNLKTSTEEIHMDQVMEAYEFLTQIDTIILINWKQNNKYARI